MTGFILIFFDDSTDLAGGDLPPSAGKQARPVSSRADRAAPIPQPVKTAEVSKNSTFTLKTTADYRPHCQKPDACAASGLRHCYTCQKLIAVDGVPS